MRSVKSSLKPNGVVAINTFTTPMNPYRQAEVDLCQNEFDLVYLAVSQGNRIVFGRDLKNAEPRNKLAFFDHITRSATLINLTQFSIFNEILMTRFV